MSGAPIQTLLVLAALLYFLRKDVYSPYMMLRRNGWRLYRRYDLSLPIKLDGLEVRTLNISAGGALIDWHPNPKKEGDPIQLELRVDDQTFQMEGGITGVHLNGTGIAFRYLSRETTNRLRDTLSEMEKMGGQSKVS
jgi:hypothetical protein